MHIAKCLAKFWPIFFTFLTWQHCPDTSLKLVCNESISLQFFFEDFEHQVNMLYQETFMDYLCKDTY